MKRSSAVFLSLALSLTFFVGCRIRDMPKTTNSDTTNATKKDVTNNRTLSAWQIDENRNFIDDLHNQLHFHHTDSK